MDTIKEVMEMLLGNGTRRSWIPGLLVIALTAVGCAGPSTQGSASQSRRADAEQGAEIWRTTCYRCHNRRPATEFSEEEWAVLVDHMRTRANLTRGEADAVTTFLQELAASR